MAIELRVDNTGMATVVVACVHCGGDIVIPGDGLAVWAKGSEPDPVNGTVFRAEYAHRGCEDRFLEEMGEQDVKVGEKINVPLDELFSWLGHPSAAGHGDPDGGEE